MDMRHPPHGPRQLLGVGAAMLIFAGMGALWLGAPKALGWTMAGAGMAGVIAFGAPGRGDGDGGDPDDAGDDAGDGGGDGGGE